MAAHARAPSVPTPGGRVPFAFSRQCVPTAHRQSTRLRFFHDGFTRADRPEWQSTAHGGSSGRYQPSGTVPCDTSPSFPTIAKASSEFVVAVIDPVPDETNPFPPPLSTAVRLSRHPGTSHQSVRPTLACPDLGRFQSPVTPYPPAHPICTSHSLLIPGLTTMPAAVGTGGRSLSTGSSENHSSRGPRRGLGRSLASCSSSFFSHPKQVFQFPLQKKSVTLGPVPSTRWPGRVPVPVRPGC
jgi:hypothetical protein